MKLCSSCPTLVAITSNNCGHCVRMRPEIDKLIARDGTPGSIHTVDLVQQNHPDAASAFGVRGFPTLLIFEPKTKQFLDYDGDRTATAMTTTAHTQSKQVTLNKWTKHPSIVDKETTHLSTV